jgi:putative transposase
MARGPRISFPGAVIHVLNRFVDRHPFFRRDEDYERFLGIFFEEARSFRISVFAYDLLPNHFHMVIEMHDDQLSAFLRRFLTRAARDLNRSMGRSGRVFQGRAKTLLVESDRHFETVLGYVLLNRVRAGLAKNVFSDEWNSVSELLSRNESRLDRERLWPHLFGHPFQPSRIDDQLDHCKKWLRGLDAANNEAIFKEEHRGSFLGSAEFRGEILRRNERRIASKDSSRRRKTDRLSPIKSVSVVEAVCRKVAEEHDQLLRPWRSIEVACTHLAWYLLSTEGHWPFARIRAACLPDGAGHSRISMAVTDIRRDAKKRAAAETAARMLHDSLS